MCCALESVLLHKFMIDIDVERV